MINKKFNGQQKIIILYVLNSTLVALVFWKHSEKLSFTNSTRKLFEFSLYFLQNPFRLSFLNLFSHFFITLHGQHFQCLTIPINAEWQFCPSPCCIQMTQMSLYKTWLSTRILFGNRILKYNTKNIISTYFYEKCD